MRTENGSGSDGASPTTLEAELAAMRIQVALLNSENARLLRLLELTPQQARLGDIVRAATAGDAGIAWESAAVPAPAGQPPLPRSHDRASQRTGCADPLAVQRL